MVFEHLRHCCSLLRVTAINLTLQWSRRDQLRVLPELATYFNDPDPLVRSAAINATCQMLTALGTDLLLKYIPALAAAIYTDRDPSVRSAAINATGQLLQALAEAINKDPDPSVRVAAIKGTFRFPIDLDPNLRLLYIPALAEAIYEDLDRHVRLAAIDATWYLSINLDPNSQFQYHSHVLPALAVAISEDPDPHVRLDAINASFQLSLDLDPNLPLPDLYGSYVLPALHVAICDFKDFLVQEHAAFAMINISKNCPLDTPRYLLVTVGTLLERRREEDIASDQTSIRAIRAIRKFLQRFEEKLPHDTWTSTFNRLRPEQQAEFRSILEEQDLIPILRFY